jgi:hypothetical protein
MAAFAASSVPNGPRASGRPSSSACSPSRTSQPLDDCSTVNRPSIERYVPARSRLSASGASAFDGFFARGSPFAAMAGSLPEVLPGGIDSNPVRRDDPAMADDPGRSDEPGPIDPREAARIRRRDRDAAAEARDLMRPGMGKVFKQIQDAQARAGKASGKPRRGRSRGRGRKI